MADTHKKKQTERKQQQMFAIESSYAGMKNKTDPNYESYRKALNRNWGNQKANPALKTKTGNT